LDNQIQIKNGKQKDMDGIIEKPEEESSESPESEELQKVTKERIERFKKAFRPTWLIKELDSINDKKGK
jgi:hypothetical protein